MTTTDTTTTDSADFRVHVVAESIRLFAENGYEATSVDQIAAAAGISRRTFFRQFRAKEDVIFADHETLLTSVDDRLAESTTDPWQAVCDAAELVFEHFHQTRDLAVRRLGIVQEVPALRDRELVTQYRYQRAFEDFLRRRVPDETPERLVAFAAAVTAAHNYLLRSMLRGDVDATLPRLRAELTRLVTIFHSDAPGTECPAGARSDREVAVITFAPGTSVEEIARRVGDELGR